MWYILTCYTNSFQPIFFYIIYGTNNTLTEKPELKISQNDVQMNETGSFSAVCSASGDPKPIVCF